MTEYQEITINFTTVEEYERELDYQCNTLGYNLTDSFPQYLVDEAFRRFTINITENFKNT